MRIEVYTDAPDKDGWYVGRLFDPSMDFAVADIHMFEPDDDENLKEKLRLLGWRLNSSPQHNSGGWSASLQKLTNGPDGVREIVCKVLHTQ